MLPLFLNKEPEVIRLAEGHPRRSEWRTDSPSQNGGSAKPHCLVRLVCLLGWLRIQSPQELTKWTSVFGATDKGFMSFGGLLILFKS